MTIDIEEAWTSQVKEFAYAMILVKKRTVPQNYNIATLSRFTRSISLYSLFNLLSENHLSVMCKCYALQTHTVHVQKQQQVVKGSQIPVVQWKS